MRIRHVVMVIAVSVAATFSTIVLLLQSGLPIVCRADCDPGDCAVPGLACCNGDMNGDHQLDIADPVYLLSHLFAEGPAPVAFAACTQTPEECADLEFGRFVAGSYVSTSTAGKMLTTFGAGGSVVVSTAGGSTSHGTWWRTGEHQATALTMSFFTDDEGTITTTVTVLSVSDFNEDCSERTGTMHVAFYNGPLNPIENPGTQPSGEQDYTFTSLKIK